MVLLLSVELLVFSSFVSIPLATPTAKNIERCLQNLEFEIFTLLPEQVKTRLEERVSIVSSKQEVRISSYVPLLPVAAALGYTLGFPLSLIASSLFLLLGFAGPQQHLYLFASGGGISYWQEPGFGYLLGLVSAAWFASILSPEEERKSWRQLGSAFGAVILCHLVGLLYLFGTSIAVLLFEGEQAYLNFQPYLPEQIRNLSWYTLPYDLIFASALIALSFPFRWLFGILTSPDIAHRHRPKVEAQLEVLQESTV